MLGNGRGAGGLVAALFALGFATGVRAQGLDALQVTWNGPLTCTAPQRLQAEVAELLGADFVLAGPALAQVRVRSEGAGLRLELEVQADGQIGRRELLLAGCDEARKAAPVLIALSLNPDMVPPEFETNPPPEPEPKAETKPPPEPEAEPEPEADEPTTPGGPRRPWGLGLLAGVDTATRPDLSALLALRGLWQELWFQAHTDLSLVVPGQAGLAGGTVDVAGGVVALGVGACGGPFLGPLYVAACAGAEGGLYWAASRGVAQAESDRTPWAAGRLGGQIAYPVGRFSVQLEALASVPFTRPVLALADLGTVHTTAPVSFRATLGLLVLLGSVDSAAVGQ